MSSEKQLAKDMGFTEKKADDFAKMVMIDDTDLEIQLRENPYNKMQVSDLIYKISEKVVIAERGVYALKSEKLDSYKFGGNAKYNFTELKYKIEGDFDVLTAEENLEKLKNKLAYLERLLNILTDKNYNIKNIIDYKKFMAGLDR